MVAKDVGCHIEARSFSVAILDCQIHDSALANGRLRRTDGRALDLHLSVGDCISTRIPLSIYEEVYIQV